MTMQDGRRPSPNAVPDASPSVQFPDLPVSHRFSEDAISDTLLSPAKAAFSIPEGSNGAPPDEKLAPRRKHIQWSNGTLPEWKHGRQKSLSEAIRNVKMRRASVTENAQEIAEALKAPVSPTLVALCGFWYMTSIFSNASSKAILIAFRKPVTLTLVQFGFVSAWCLISSFLAQRFPVLQTAIPALKYSIRPPSRDLIITTLPLTIFQIGGHILNSDAMSRIPVSLVHTIKGLSPLMTVLAYRLYWRIPHSFWTYVSLVPLTLGVIMACSADFNANMLGLITALGSTLLFVTQNLVSKKLFDEASQVESDGLMHLQPPRKPDKLNLLCYSSLLAFAFTFPIWAWSDGWKLLADLLTQGTVPLSDRPGRLDHGRLALEFIFNGTFHFAQSLVAFVLLSMVSPVTYSVASLIKRVFVITFAIVWFGNPMTRIQAFGIGLTFVGLYLYDRTNDAARGERRRRLKDSRSDVPLLPLIREAADDHRKDYAPTKLLLHGGRDASHISDNRTGQVLPNIVTGGFREKNDDSRKRSSPVPHDPNSVPVWLPPGTKQEQTWTIDERHENHRGTANGTLN